MTRKKWIRVYDGENQHVRTDSIGADRREHKSLGRSNDKPANVKVEIRAATLAMSWCRQTEEDYEGWRSHRLHGDVSRFGLAGWLEREISTHDERQERLAKERRQAEHDAASSDFNALCDGHLANVEAPIANVASAPPPLGWQAKVHAACDVVDEQTRHDVAQSVARHAEIDPKTQLVIGLLKMSNPADPGHATLCEQLCGMLPSETATLDGIDQSEPATQPSEPLVEQPDIHSEPTHVGAIDDRFEDGDGL